MATRKIQQGTPRVIPSPDYGTLAQLAALQRNLRPLLADLLNSCAPVEQHVTPTAPEVTELLTCMLTLARKLPAVLRAGQGDIRIYVHNHEVRDVAAAPKEPVRGWLLDE